MTNLFLRLCLLFVLVVGGLYNPSPFIFFTSFFAFLGSLCKLDYHYFLSYLFVYLYIYLYLSLLSYPYLVCLSFYLILIFLFIFLDRD